MSSTSSTRKRSSRSSTRSLTKLFACHPEFYRIIAELREDDPYLDRYNLASFLLFVLYISHYLGTKKNPAPDFSYQELALLFGFDEECKIWDSLDEVLDIIDGIATDMMVDLGDFFDILSKSSHPIFCYRIVQHEPYLIIIHFSQGVTL